MSTSYQPNLSKLSRKEHLINSAKRKKSKKINHLSSSALNLVLNRPKKLSKKLKTERSIRKDWRNMRLKLYVRIRIRVNTKWKVVLITLRKQSSYWVWEPVMKKWSQNSRSILKETENRHSRHNNSNYLVEFKIIEV